MARIHTKIRSDSHKIEDRWWRSFHPNTYNDIPPNGTIMATDSNRQMDQSINKKMADMTYSTWKSKLSKEKIGLGTLEIIAGINRFGKTMPKVQK